MGTRSRIGIELKDHSVVSTYCHYDGYPEHNGKILTNLYTTKEQVSNLIDGGSMSSLHTSHVWETKALRNEANEIITDSAGNWMYEPTRPNQPLYHTERGEEIEVSHANFNEFISGNSGEEYAYLFTRNNQWKCYKIGWGDTNTKEIPLNNL
jgi:hypothetical protein